MAGTSDMECCRSHDFGDRFYGQDNQRNFAGRIYVLYCMKSVLKVLPQDSFLSAINQTMVIGEASN